MQDLLNPVLNGFKEYITGFKGQTDIIFSLNTFNSSGVKRIYDQEQITKVKPLSKKTYSPNFGTPLYDSVMEVLLKMEKDVENITLNQNRAVAALVVIQTDGLENESKKYKKKDLVELVNKLKSSGQYTIVYAGANQDSFAESEGIATSVGTVVNWDYTLQGTEQYFSNLRSATIAYANNTASAYKTSGGLHSSLHVDNFWNEDSNLVSDTTAGTNGNKK